MDWAPLVIGLLAGVGQGALDQYAGGTGFFGTHHRILYEGALFVGGAYGDLTGRLSPDLSYGLMVSSLALLAEDLTFGGVHGAIGAVYPDAAGAYAPPTYDPNAPWPSSPHLTVPSAAGAVYSTGREGIYSSTPGMQVPTAAGAIHRDHTEAERTWLKSRSLTPVGAAG